MNESASKFISNIKLMILNPIIGFMFAVAVVMFVYGIVEYIWGAENKDKIEDGKRHMVWGVIGMFAMLVVYGILNVLSDFWWEVGAGY